MLKSIITILLFFGCFHCFSQDERKLEVHTDYQFLKYKYIQLGIGFAPKKHLISVNRTNKSFSFIGYRFSYSKNLNNSDWGLSTQAMVLGGHFRNLSGFGIELNYKSIDNNNHFCFKPLIGFSFPYVNAMYGYNFDFYKNKSERVSQHEIILGFSLNVLKW